LTALLKSGGGLHVLEGVGWSNAAVCLALVSVQCLRMAHCTTTKRRMSIL